MSPNRLEYEDLRLNKQIILKDIIQIAKNMHGESLAFSTLSRHFNSCIQPYIDLSIKSSKLRDNFVRNKIQEDINAAINISKTITMLNEQLVSIRGKMDDEEARREAREIAKILDSVMRTALQYSEKLKPEGNKDSEDIYDRLLWSLEQAEVPMDYIKKIQTAWESYGK
jgi:ATP-dependent Lon protease